MSAKVGLAERPTSGNPKPMEEAAKAAAERLPVLRKKRVLPV